VSRMIDTHTRQVVSWKAAIRKKNQLVIKDAQIEKFFDLDTPPRTHCGGRKEGLRKQAADASELR
jgi:hypothetical protein